MLTDPTGGAGYAFGQILPSSHMTTLAQQQVRALDIVNGGSYTQSDHATIAGTKNITLSGSGYLNISRNLNCSGSVEIDCTSVVNSGRDFTWLGTTNLPKIGSRTYIFTQPLDAAYIDKLDSGAPVWAYLTTQGEYQQVSVAGGTAPHVLVIPIRRLPNQGVFDKCRVVITGAGNGGGSHSALPATLPTATLYRRSQTVGTASTVGAAVTDNPGTFGNYDTRHALAATYNLHDGSGDEWTWTGINELVDSNAHYWVVITGEANANSAANALSVIGLECAFTCTQVGPG